MKGRAILLLGGSGFIGTALAARLRAMEAEVAVVSRHSPVEPVDGVRYRVGSLDENVLLRELLPGMDAVVHLAAATTPGSSAADPLTELQGNLLPTLRLIEAAQEGPPRHLVFVSSGGTRYGDADVVPTNEQADPRPASYHGAGKVAQEAFLRAFGEMFQWRVSILRPSNVYGPGQALRDGFGFVRTVLARASAGAPVVIWGDGEIVRDFVFIDDTVDAIAACLERRDDQGTYNVGSGTGHTLNQVIEVARQVIGRPLEVQYRAPRRVDVREVILDCAHIRRRLGWEPKVGLASGVERTWQWHLQSR